MDKLLSVTQSAALLDLHPVTLQRAIAKGELKSLKVGRRRLISTSQLEAWIKKINKKGK
ncbi:MAG: helix-turn-helix domain-containing protein [Nitrospirae bacterium]|jgi:excisionase family DNA binding protein|nr:helix-turn-helix domain-containing protein [Nitrospirota bacterium]